MDIETILKETDELRAKGLKSGDKTYLTQILGVLNTGIDYVKHSADELLHRKLYILNKLGRFTDIITISNEAIRINPKDAVAYALRGQALFNLGRFDESIPDFTESINLNQNDAVSYIDRGSALIELGRFDESIPDFTKSINLNPKDAVAYALRGQALINLGRFDESIPDFTEAINLDRKDALVYNNRGYALIGIGKFNEAIADLNKSIELDGKKGYYAYSHLGAAHRLSGNTLLAQQNYEKALALFRALQRKEMFDYRPAIRAERGLATLGVVTEPPIEKEALDKGIVTPAILDMFYKFEK